jgi:hypothetical protein
MQATIKPAAEAATGKTWNVLIKNFNITRWSRRAVPPTTTYLAKYVTLSEALVPNRNQVGIDQRLQQRDINIEDKNGDNE